MGLLAIDAHQNPVEDYIKKGGKLEDTIGRKCLCNGLVSAIGLEQKEQTVMNCLW